MKGTLRAIAFDMVSAYTLPHPELFREYFEFRKPVFNDGEGYLQPEWQGMEFDQFDVPATSYIIVSDDFRNILGTVRLTPTQCKNYGPTSMIAQAWPELLSAKLQHGPETYEGTRLAIHPALPRHSQERALVGDYLVKAKMEFCQHCQIEALIGVTYPNVARSFYGSRGWAGERLPGTVHEEGHPPFSPFRYLVDDEIAAQIAATTRLSAPVLEFAPTYRVSTLAERRTAGRVEGTACMTEQARRNVDFRRDVGQQSRLVAMGL